MKKIIVLLVIMALALAFVYGCGKKAEETDKVPVEVKQAEVMDSTRMDSAAMEMDTTMVDTTAVPTDGE